MKNKLLILTTALLLSAASAFAQHDAKIGPNKGRLFELKSKTTPTIEVAAKDGKFVIYLLDAAGKQLPLGERTLEITYGERSNPQKLPVEKSGETFTAPMPEGKQFPIVFQVREQEGGKPLTARMNYDANTCPDCSQPEWLCDCH